MRCPHCDFDSKELVCPQCRQRFGSAALEELSHLDYLETLLKDWFQDRLVTRSAHQQLQQETAERRAAIEAALGIRKVPEAAPKAAPVEEVASMPSIVLARLTGRSPRRVYANAVHGVVCGWCPHLSRRWL